MKKIAPEEVGPIYGVEHWGAGYFEVSRNGHLIARPGRGDARWVDLKELVDHLVQQRGLHPPLLLRFPQILGNQLHTLHRAFQEAGRAFDWSGGHYPVFPMKVHPLTAGKPYYLGLFLVGAYQEVMGSYHNLFGQPDEAQVVMDEGGSYHVTKVVPGSRVADMLAFARYDPAALRENFRRMLAARVEDGELTAKAAAELAKRYDADVQRYTYLE